MSFQEYNVDVYHFAQICDVYLLICLQTLTTMDFWIRMISSAWHCEPVLSKAKVSFSHKIIYVSKIVYF